VSAALIYIYNISMTSLTVAILSCCVATGCMCTFQGLLRLWRVRPFLGHGLPDRLPPNVSFLLPPSSSVFGTNLRHHPTALFPLPLGFPKGLLPPRHPPVTFFSEVRELSILTICGHLRAY
jgi:hypothetical protein